MEQQPTDQLDKSQPVQERPRFDMHFAHLTLVACKLGLNAAETLVLPRVVMDIVTEENPSLDKFGVVLANILSDLVQDGPAGGLGPKAVRTILRSAVRHWAEQPPATKLFADYKELLGVDLRLDAPPIHPGATEGKP